ncbi:MULTISPECIES: MarR family transcriptional regulator [unclassified Dehalobacter]|uniref:MarR family winged helix-turn-helix transcriptional regulator n=1 Tax=unclassified Dehalobacter TaxID=2635733 RepID=UPI000E6C2EEB|nr:MULTISPECIES: MarR family transcriptional regulator [unclassified Dehalobacter]RJE47141.1 MarR family transcriptional regulator [Dehalobacter sp. MCB1]TCX53698.1 MarR family transcriptional regulator [Dehalobacter sp. 14DCB1]TCX55001.1 MarR family transcriptional regulator [Dehalobacter sp. 12DCB1]
MDEMKKQANIFGMIFVLANRLQVLGDAFDQNITIKQWLFLVSVARFEEPPTVSEAADDIGYSRQNAKRLAATLAEHGFVTISKDKSDARALRIMLTPKFHTYFAARRQREVEFMQQIFSGFDPELTDRFYQGLVKISRNIEMMENENEEIKE